LADSLRVGRLLVKDESSRLGLPSFKPLGAFWAVANVVSERSGLAEPFTLDRLRAAAAAAAVPCTLVTATDGNHGRAVARFGSLLGLPVHVFVPDVVSPSAMAAIAGEGAVVTEVAGSHSTAVAEAVDFVDGRAHTALVQDTAWPGYEDIPSRIVEGYHTLFVEISDQLGSEPDLVAVPVGVGSLAQAAVAYYRSRADASATALLSCEADTATCVLSSLLAGRPTTVETGATIMAGLNCSTVSSLAWPYLRDGLDGAVAISDQAASRAVGVLAGVGLAAGASGAASLAGAEAGLTGDGADARRLALGITDESTVVLLCTEGSEGAGGVGHPERSARD
jgi:diaminopropionate ammonia-lyase